MRPPPRSLPAATSTKWHNRRLWDPLGYIRVRTLANPAWSRDVAWLERIVRHRRRVEPQPRRDLIDQVIHELGRYRRLRQHGTEPDADFAQRREHQWDAVLTRLDLYLDALQGQHLQAVDEAGVSGRATPVAPGRQT